MASVAIDWHPLAWELALTGELWHSEGGGVCASLRLHSVNEVVRGCGATSNEAYRALARKLTHYAEVGVFDHASLG